MDHSAGIHGEGRTIGQTIGQLADAAGGQITGPPEATAVDKDL